MQSLGGSEWTRRPDLSRSPPRPLVLKVCRDQTGIASTSGEALFISVENNCFPHCAAALPVGERPEQAPAPVSRTKDTEFLRDLAQRVHESDVQTAYSFIRTQSTFLTAPPRKGRNVRGNGRFSLTRKENACKDMLIVQAEPALRSQCFRPHEKSASSLPLRNDEKEMKNHFLIKMFYLPFARGGWVWAL